MVWAAGMAGIGRRDISIDAASEDLEIRGHYRRPTHCNPSVTDRCHAKEQLTEGLINNHGWQVTRVLGIQKLPLMLAIYGYYICFLSCCSLVYIKSSW